MPTDLEILGALERKALWLATWTIHNANHLRESGDSLKVGGHQASCASLTTIMTALYFAALRPEDRVAVKPHASPVFHAIQYLSGRQTLDKLKAFRGLGGAQSYPSRTKDTDDVDFSTGSVGLGVAQTLFASLAQDFLRAKGLGTSRPEGKMVALIGDAEMDEGNIFEALLEGWKNGLRNTWWVVDYNRQSLDAVVREGLWAKFETMFRNFGWDVVVLRHGALQQAAFREPGGEKLREWIEACPNQLYSALTFAGGKAWRKRLTDELGDQGDVSALLERRSDDELARVMGNLGGHDLPSLLQAFEEARTHDRPVCFIAYTIKGFGLPLAGHKDNHAGLMTPAQVDVLRNAQNIREGFEWDHFEGLDLPHDRLRAFIEAAPFVTKDERRHAAAIIEVPTTLDVPKQASISTQQAFGLVMHEIAKRDDDFARRVVTTSPDVTVSTNLGAWINRRGLFAREALADTFKAERIPSTFTWNFSPDGQHFELGIAEMNLFIMLSALGLSHSLFGERLLPVGTLYDPFIERGLDALNYACYQDARFMVVATPSGVTLAPEGGAHQSIGTPLIGLAKDGLSSFEPAFADELAVIMRWGFAHMQRGVPSPAAQGLGIDQGSSRAIGPASLPSGEGRPEAPGWGRSDRSQHTPPDHAQDAHGRPPLRGGGRASDTPAESDPWLDDARGGAVYLRLSTRTTEQPQRIMDDALADDITRGAYWMRKPGPNAQIVVAYTGAVAPEAIEATGLLAEDRRDIGLLAITSADRLYAGWTGAQRARERGLVGARSHVEQLLDGVPRHCGLVTVIDGHPATLGWLGAVQGHRARSLGVERFGQTGTIADLYRLNGIDTQAIVRAAQAISAGAPIRHLRAIE